MARYKNAGFFGIMLGSPFAFLGLIFLLRGKVGVGLPFLLLGLISASSGAVAGGKATSPAGDQANQPPASSDGKPAEPGAAADGGAG